MPGAIRFLCLKRSSYPWLVKPLLKCFVVCFILSDGALTRCYLLENSQHDGQEEEEGSYKKALVR